VKVAGRYELGRELGRGGMASVWLARDEELDRVVALKLVAEHLAGDPELRTRFVREARIAAGLSHPNIVRVYDVGESEGRPYIVMEHVDGPSLAGRRVDADEAVDIALQVCAGLEHAHAHGVVHRDLKPHNLLRRADGMIKIADFGIARAASLTRITQVGTVLGTAQYLAPEQAAGEEVTEKADLYALGATLHELLAGRPPEPGAAGLSGVPARLEDAIMRCLARRPEYRPSASELRALLRGEAATRPVIDAPTRIAPRTRLHRARVPAAIAAALAAVIALAVVVADREDAAPERPRVAPVQAVPRAPTAAQQARNLEQWLSRYSR
jgi:serine/threonine-protein kinase